MAKFNSAEWDEIRIKFRHSIMAETSLVSLAQNLDTKEWPFKAEEEKPAKYIDFNYEELLMLPEIAGKVENADHLISILKETLAFDDPFGDMVAQVEETASKDNPILTTLSRLGIPADYPLMLANFTEGTRMVCASEGVNTIGAFATLGQQMSTRVVLGGDFRNALNTLIHGDEEGIALFLPFRKGSTGLHLAQAIGLVAAGMPRAEQLALGKNYGAKLSPADAGLAKPLTKEQVEKLEGLLRAKVMAALDWFKVEKGELVNRLAGGETLVRYFSELSDPAREAIAVKLTSPLLKAAAKSVAPVAPVEEKKRRILFPSLRAGLSRQHFVVDFPPPPPPEEPRPAGRSYAPPARAAAPGSFPAPGGMKFPAKPAGIKPLVLPRRLSPLQRAQEASQATAEARRSLDAIISKSRSPWGGKSALSDLQVEGLEKAMRVLEAKVAEREMALAEAENRLAERDRALAETEALLEARENVIDAMRKQTAETSGSVVNPEEMEALKKLKEELDRQEASMEEQRQAIKEREDFLEQSETALFEKMQAQQEQETELEQKSEDLKRAMLKAGLIKEEPGEPMEKA